MSGKFIRKSVIGKLNESIPNSLVLCDDFLNSPLLEYITGVKNKNKNRKALPEEE